MVNDNFPGEFGSERLVQQVVDSILASTELRENLQQVKGQHPAEAPPPQGMEGVATYGSGAGGGGGGSSGSSPNKAQESEGKKEIKVEIWYFFYLLYKYAHSLLLYIPVSCTCPCMVVDTNVLQVSCTYTLTVGLNIV